MPNLFVRPPVPGQGIAPCPNNMGPGIEYSLKKY